MLCDLDFKPEPAIGWTVTYRRLYFWLAVFISASIGGLWIWSVPASRTVWYASHSPSQVVSASVDKEYLVFSKKGSSWSGSYGFGGLSQPRVEKGSFLPWGRLLRLNSQKFRLFVLIVPLWMMIPLFLGMGGLMVLWRESRQWRVLPFVADVSGEWVKSPG